jgi:hypothetical protein
MRYTILSILLALSLFSQGSVAQWIRTSSIETMGLGVRALIASPDGASLFSATAKGVFRSTDNGTTWTAADSGLTNKSAHCLLFATDGAGVTNLFVGIGGNVSRSTDYGTTWTPSNAGLGVYTVYALAMRGTQIIAVGYGGASLSTDIGRSWTDIESGLPYSPNGWIIIDAVAVSGTDFVVGSSSYGLFRSTNSGTSWIAANAGLPSAKEEAYGFGATPSPSGTGTNLYLGTGSGMYLSTDNGASWILTDPQSPVPAWTSFVAVDTVIFVASNQGVIRTVIDGSRWEIVNSGLTTNSIDKLAVLGPNLYAADRSGGIWRRPLEEMMQPAVPLSWIQLSPAGLVSCLALNGRTIFAGGNGVYRSDDDGITWINMSEGIGGKSIQALAVKGRNIFAGTNDGVLIATIDSAGWRAIDSGLTSRNIRSFAVNDKCVFSATPGGVFVSTNNGERWIPLDGITGNVSALATIGSSLFAGKYDGAFTSTDDGQSWSASSVGLSTTMTCPQGHGYYIFSDVKEVLCFAVYDTNIYSGTGGLDCYSQPAGGIFRRSGSSGIWWRLSNSLGDGIVARVLAVNGSTLCAATSVGLKLSVNGGMTWDSYSEGLPPFGPTALVMNGRFLFAAGGSVWRRALFTLSVEEPRSRLPRETLFQQNYPNPFNPSTTIQYALPSRSHVTLTIFNTLGQIVRELVNDEMEAGYHEVQFDASGLASGVYLYRMTAGNFVDVKKLILMK